MPRNSRYNDSFGNELEKAASALRDFTNIVERAKRIASPGIGGVGGAGGALGAAGQAIGLGAAGARALGGIGLAASAAYGVARMADPWVQAGVYGGQTGVQGYGTRTGIDILGSLPVLRSVSGMDKASFSTGQARDRTLELLGPIAAAGGQISDETVAATFDFQARRARNAFDFSKGLDAQLLRSGAFGRNLRESAGPATEALSQQMGIQSEVLQKLGEGVGLLEAIKNAVQREGFRRVFGK